MSIAAQPHHLIDRPLLGLVVARQAPLPLVDACVRVAFAMFTTGFLGFLGLGVPEPTPDWGTMISEGRTWIFRAAWAPVFPMIGITTLVIALNLLADGLRQAGWVD